LGGKLNFEMIRFKHLYLVTIIIFCVISCKKNATDAENELATDDTLKVEDQKDIRSIGETLDPEARKKVKDWPEYQQLDEFLTTFYSISPNEALNLSKELSTTTQQLKDSLKIERFKEPDILIRLNVLHNYSLRLNDMENISSIKPDEVKEGIQNILDAFSALNSKINNITNQEKLEADLKGFEDTFTSESNDTNSIKNKDKSKRDSSILKKILE